MLSIFIISRSKARHVRRFLYEDSEEDSDPPPEYVYFLISSMKYPAGVNLIERRQ